MYKSVIGALGLFLMLVSCQSGHQIVLESQRFETSVRKELPFRVDSIRWIDGADIVTFQFSSQDEVLTPPDAEISLDGELSAYRAFFSEKSTRQVEDKIWRNVVVSEKNRRVICVDRYLREGKTQGYIYVLQSESKQFPTYGRYHWDVSDSHNVELVGMTLYHLREIAVKRFKGNDGLEEPFSQEAYWSLIFHADSLFADGLYAEAKQVYDLAFTSDSYILPSHLSTIASKMMSIGNDEAALAYVNHRLAMEPDYYEEPTTSPYQQLKDTFELRKRTWNYDLALKQKLEWVFERDQYDRMLWYMASNRRSESPLRVEKLARRSMDTDSTNLMIVGQILSETGYPRRSQVGEFASQSVWLVFQHNDLDHQKQFLPQLEETVRQGDVAPMTLAFLKDRIDIREGRLQKYGTQLNNPLLDSLRVNEWRQEVGLPPLELK